MKKHSENKYEIIETKGDIYLNEEDKKLLQEICNYYNQPPEKIVNDIIHMGIQTWKDIVKSAITSGVVGYCDNLVNDNEKIN